LRLLSKKLKAAAAQYDMLHRGTGRLVEESLDAPCKKTGFLAVLAGLANLTSSDLW